MTNKQTSLAEEMVKFRNIANDTLDSKPPYLDNDDEMNLIDFTCIMDSIGEFKYISSQVLRDVVDEITGELENRIEPTETPAEEWTGEESLDEISRSENAVLDRAARGDV